jgi:hypothetical protein
MIVNNCVQDLLRSDFHKRFMVSTLSLSLFDVVYGLIAEELGDYANPP